VVKSRKLGWAVNVTRVRKDKSALKILTGKFIGKRHLKSPNRRCGDNIRIE